MEPIAGGQLPISLTEFAQNTIRSMIVEGTLVLGQQVSEVALAASLRLSKTPVREALVRLQQEGLVEIHPRRGTFVFLPTEQELMEICRFREWIECAALTEAIKIDRDAFVMLLSRIVKEMGVHIRKKNLDEYQKKDTEFHACIVESCGNRYLTQSYANIAAKMSAMRMRYSASFEHIRKSYDDHVAIFEFVKKGDKRGALALLARHVSWNQGSFWSLHAKSFDLAVRSRASAV